MISNYEPNENMAKRKPTKKAAKKAAPKKKTPVKKAASKKPKPLKGVGLTVLQQLDGEDKSPLGVVIAPNVNKLKELFRVMHNASIDVNLPDVRAWEIKEIR